MARVAGATHPTQHAPRTALSTTSTTTSTTTATPGSALQFFSSKGKFPPEGVKQLPLLLPLLLLQRASSAHAQNLNFMADAAGNGDDSDCSAA